MEIALEVKPVDINRLVQKIFEIVVLGVESKWQSLEFLYRADSSQSGYFGSYNIVEAQKYFDPTALSSEELSELEDLLETLRNETKEISGEPFTHCKLLFESSGDFKIEYGYDPVDWSVRTG